MLVVSILHLMGSQFLQKTQRYASDCYAPPFRRNWQSLILLFNLSLFFFFLLSYIFASSTPLTSNCVSLLFGTWEGLGDESIFYRQKVGTWRGLFPGGSCRVLFQEVSDQKEAGIRERA